MNESASGFGQYYSTAALKEGSQDAFRAFYEQYWENMFLFASHFLGNEEEAKDLVQDSFMKFWESRARLNDRYPPHFYLHRILKNNTINLIRRKKSLLFKLSVLEDRSISGDGASLSGDGASFNNAASTMEEKELRLELEKAIDNLPARMKEIFRMSRNGHMSILEISETLQLSSQTVKNQLTSALKLLRTRLRSAIHFFF